MDVFVYLADHANELVARDQLLERVWSKQVAADELLTGAVSDLRRALQGHQDDLKYIETIPKRGYRLIGEVLPIESVKSEKSLAPGSAAAVPSATKPTIRRGTAWTVGVAIIAATILVMLSFDGLRERLLDDTAPGTITSIAVLPFVNLSDDPEQEYFADGLTEEILNSLAQLPELQVKARTSSFFFKGQNIPVSEIADRLNVAHIVEGSVRRDGERLRITAQLIRAADGFHLLSRSYDRTLDDIFAVQQDIAENIAEALQVVLDDDARKRMRNVGIRDVEAFIAYQKGLNAYNKAHEVGTNTMDWLAIANPYFDRVLEATPGLAAARIMRADVHVHIYVAIANGSRDEKYPGEAEESVAAYRNALDLATRLSPPGNLRDNLALARTLNGDDWTGLIARIQKAMQPGTCAKQKAFYDPIIPFGWAEQVTEKFRETIECDPMDAIAKFDLAWALVWAGNPEGALRVGDEAANGGVIYRFWRFSRYKAMLAVGRVDDAMAYAKGWEWFEPGLAIHRAALAGDADLARQLAKAYRSTINEHSEFALYIAAIAGDREWANDVAARIDAHPGGTMVLAGAVAACLCGAPFDLKATPNYKARVEEAGFTWPPVTIIEYPTKSW